MRRAKIEVTTEVLKPFIEHLPSGYRVIGSEHSLGKEAVILWLEGDDLPGTDWVTAVVTQKIVYDMEFREAPVKDALAPNTKRFSATRP